MQELKKDLSLNGLIMIAIGSCIGVGVFITPSSIAGHLQNANWILLAWAVGGVMALTGALTFAELGGLFPKTGGVYVFLKEAYGDFVAFLYGWAILLVITSGAIAALALAFARFVGFLIPLEPVLIKGLAISSIVLLTGMNILGVKFGDIFSKIFTGFKLFGIAGIILIAFLFTSGEVREINFNLAGTVPDLGSAFAAALIGVFFSFGGWHHASFLAGETDNPKRNIPRAMIIGATVVTITYLLVNLAYLFLLPMDELAASQTVASDALKKVFYFGSVIVTILIILSSFGSIGIYTLSAPRIYFAMARDKIFFPQLAKVHPKYGTPHVAMILQSTWAIILILLWGTFEHLIEYVVFMDWLFMTLGAISIYIFRVKRKEMDRPYKTLGYPIIPIVFIGISVWFILKILTDDHGTTDHFINSPIKGGLLVVAIGIPFYLFFKWRGKLQ